MNPVNANEPTLFTYPLVFNDVIGTVNLVVQPNVTAVEAFDLMFMLVMVFQTQGQFAWRKWANDRKLLRHLPPAKPPSSLILPPTAH